MKIGPGIAWFARIVRLSLSLSVLVAIGEDRRIFQVFIFYETVRCWTARRKPRKERKNRK
jgi:hypothetical protein